MIYRVVLDDTIDIHTSDINCMLLNPSIELEMNSAGSFTFTLPPTHPNWDDIRVLKSTIDVYENNELIFTGRVASIEKNWNNERVVKCEGALAYFNDSIHRQMKWETPLPIASEDPTVHNFLKDILDNHNVFEGSENLNRHIYIGHIYVDTELVTREVDYDTTLDILTRMCIDTNGGYLQIRKDPEDGKLYLDWLKDFTDESSQPASFGLNLLNFDTSISAEDICTGVLARGATVNDQVVTLTDVELVDETTYPDYSVTHYTDHDQDILWHRDGVATFGQVVQVHDFSDAQIAWKDQGGQVVVNSLFEVAKKWLEEKNTKVETTEVEVAELNWLGEGYPQFKLGQIVEVIDSVHMSGESETTRLLPMYKMSCDLTNGSKKVTLGTPPKKELTQISASNSDSNTLSTGSSSSGSGSGGGGTECLVQDVWVNGVSVVSGKIARITVPTDTVTQSQMNTAINAAVAPKANTSDVNDALALKANTVDVNDALALKANTVDVTNALALKANTIDVTNALALKADKSEIIDVEANPSETATDDLTTIKIGDTVYDIPGGGGSGLSDYYSTEERVVGRWTDGKPLYQKTINCGSISRTGTTTISHNIDNLERAVTIIGNCINNSGVMFPIPLVQSGDIISYQIRVSINNTSISLSTVSVTDISSCYVTIQYTKTTDAAGTGPTPGNLVYLPALYSEEEREIGVWVDGKPLYQKTCLFTIPNTSGGYDFSVSTTNLDKIVETCYSISNVGERRYVPWYNNATVEFDEMTDSRVTFYFQSTYHAGRTLIFTAKYTKTTDQPGSGRYLPDGQYAHHYSTSEKVVGTWIDGSPIYERTWDFSASPKTVAYNSWTSLGINIPNAKELLSSEISSGLGGIDACGIEFELRVNDNYSVYAEYNQNANTRKIKYLTFQYTKTT